ncbi:undecaprenyl-diphosphatase [Eubacterium uniforme]|uniref:Undecaprenyl-diphosphatase n=1 Tax=Eubacterium uniforme TaxID=39495 RepID=A0A1T4VXC5_9FIRM|nr:phosphatase PAP2 family protein [Eubacterium uniforme]SKA69458.1 undecaprenyl-diphosphatase [Eubacterium uniforme]
MEVLEFFQDIRNPFLTFLFRLLSYAASEIIVIVAVCVLVWCVDKKLGYRLIFGFYISAILVWSIKIICRVPRPWVRSKNIKPVKSALSDATGYSFPSGHTQSASSFYGTFAYVARKNITKILLILLIIGVAFSRMYLGVHTPLDVSMGFLISIVATYAFNDLLDRGIIYKARQEALLFLLLFVSLCLTAFGVICVQTNYIDTENAYDFFKMIGISYGLSIGWYLESTKLDFKTDNKSIKEKAIILIVGLVIMLLIKSGIKHIFGETLLIDVIRYFIVILFATYIYPLIFENIHNKYLKNNTDMIKS